MKAPGAQGDKRCNPRQLDVVIATPYGRGGRGGIDRLTDAITLALKLRPDLNIRLRGLRTRGSGSVLFSPVFLCLALLQLCVARCIGRADVVHINIASNGSLYRKATVAVVARCLGVPYVVHLHNGAFDAFWQGAGPRLTQIIDDVLSRSSGIIVLGPYWHTLIERRLPGVGKKVFVLPNATSATSVRPRPTSSDRVRISFFGKLGPSKGTPELVRALSMLANRGDWTATLAGNGDVAATRLQLTHFGISDRVSVPGWLESDDTATLMSQTDIVVQPSFVDNQPMAIMEAFAYGIPVVATAVGVVPDIVVHNVTGLLVRPGDVSALASALAQLIDDADLRQRLGVAAKHQHATRYEMNGYLNRLVDIWRHAAHATLEGEGAKHPATAPQAQYEPSRLK